MSLTAFERRVVFLIGAVQFINILDFMMVMPLGPDFAIALGIPASHIGFVGGSYTAAACIAGLAGSLFLDRFDRRKALAAAMFGLVVATALGGFAVDLTTLVAARIVAGLFGGPASALTLAVIADAVAPERRGRAMGAVMGAFSMAAVLGVPAGLELARLGGWRMPFFAVAALGLVIVVAALAVLPPQRGHLGDGHGGGPGGSVASGARRLLALLARPTELIAYALAFCTLCSMFLQIPNISAWVQFNLGFPREQIGLLYLTGGLLSFFGMRLAGRLVDRWGATPMTFGTTMLLTALIYLFYIDYRPAIPVIVLFAAFMLVSSARMVAQSTVYTKVPAPAERAGFMSLVSAVQNLASATGAFLSAQILTIGPGDRLEHMATVGWLAIALGLLAPPLMAVLERRLRRPAAGAVASGSRAADHRPGGTGGDDLP